MDGIKTIDDLIRAKNLTPDEMIQFKDLIEEFKEREKRIEENISAARTNLNQLMHSIGMLGEKTSVLGKTLQSLLNEMDIARLKLMPDENFYRE
jgi:FtsZ-binding cell division protein ZapB